MITPPRRLRSSFPSPSCIGRATAASLALALSSLASAQTLYTPGGTVGNIGGVNVGIGTANPGAKLDVQASGSPAFRVFDGAGDSGTIDFRRTADGWHMGTIKMSHAGNYGSSLSFKLHPNDGSMSTAPVDVMTVVATGNVGIGTTNPTARLDIANNTNFNPGANLSSAIKVGGNYGGGLVFSDIAYAAGIWSVDGGQTLAFGTNGSVGGFGSPYGQMVLKNGNVGIGTTNPTQKLSVNGTIRAKEVIIEASPWPDDVFAPGYALPSVDEVAAHIAAEGHLPGVPSAATIAEQGVALGEMQKTLLRKVEELTLYMITQDKKLSDAMSRIDAQAREIEQLKRENGAAHPTQQ